MQWLQSKIQITGIKYKTFSTFLYYRKHNGTYLSQQIPGVAFGRAWVFLIKVILHGSQHGVGPLCGGAFGEIMPT